MRTPIKMTLVPRSTDKINRRVPSPDPPLYLPNEICGAPSDLVARFNQNLLFRFFSLCLRGPEKRGPEKPDPENHITEIDLQIISFFDWCSFGADEAIRGRYGNGRPRVDEYRRRHFSPLLEEAMVNIKWYKEPDENDREHGCYLTRICKKGRLNEDEVFLKNRLIVNRYYEAALAVMRSAFDNEPVLFWKLRMNGYDPYFVQWLVFMFESIQEAIEGYKTSISESPSKPVFTHKHNTRL